MKKKILYLNNNLYIGFYCYNLKQSTVALEQLAQTYIFLFYKTKNNKFIKKKQVNNNKMK